MMFQPPKPVGDMCEWIKDRCWHVASDDVALIGNFPSFHTLWSPYGFVLHNSRSKLLYSPFVLRASLILPFCVCWRLHVVNNTFWGSLCYWLSSSSCYFHFVCIQVVFSALFFRRHQSVFLAQDERSLSTLVHNTDRSYNFVRLMSAGSREDGRSWLNGSISSWNAICCHPRFTYCVLQQGALTNPYRRAPKPGNNRKENNVTLLTAPVWMCVSEVGREISRLNPLTPELNPSAQCCVTRFFTGDFAFRWYMHGKPTNTQIIHSIY
jgi:hypothetical protein